MYNVKVVDPDAGGIPGYRESGGICLSGPTTRMGCFDAPEEAANILYRHDHGALWVHTGDIGRIDDDGFCLFQGCVLEAPLGQGHFHCGQAPDGGCQRL